MAHDEFILKPTCAAMCTIVVTASCAFRRPLPGSCGRASQRRPIPHSRPASDAFPYAIAASDWIPNRPGLLDSAAQVVRGLRRLVGGGEDGPLVAPQHSEGL